MSLMRSIRSGLSSNYFLLSIISIASLAELNPIVPSNSFILFNLFRSIRTAITDKTKADLSIDPKKNRCEGIDAVSYTHLTLPTR